LRFPGIDLVDCGKPRVLVGTGRPSIVPSLVRLHVLVFTPNPFTEEKRIAGSIGELSKTNKKGRGERAVVLSEE
jgi:hypothetical protein